VLEPDSLVRLLVLPAVAALGFVPTGEASAGARAGGMSGPAGGVEVAPAAVFVPLERLPDCRRARREVVGQALAPYAAALHAAAHADAALPVAAASVPPPLLVGYGAGPEALLAAHRAHRCCDLVVRLTAGANGEPALVHPAAPDRVAAAELSLREADVLVLLLQGFTTPAVAARLSVAPSTARSHCRAVLRKLGVRDRRGLRALLSGPPPAAGAGRPAEPRDAGRLVKPRRALRRGLAGPAPRFDEGGASALPRNGP